MISLKRIRRDPDALRTAVSQKGESVNVERILELDAEIRGIIQEVESLKAERNRASDEISRLKQAGGDPDDIVGEMKNLSATIKTQDAALKDLREELNELLRWVPNFPHPSVPVGADESANIEVRMWGEPPDMDFEPADHLELGRSLGILDFERSSKISGSGFPLFMGKGAKLERALVNFMMEHHASRGYSEVFPPFLASRAATEATGQLPKLEEDMYLSTEDDLFLIPTAEVPITNIHRDEILSCDQLPIRYVAYSACFRREAGSYGKETRGLLRVHQFNKVELVKLVEGGNSYDELESLTEDAESILQALGIHYRVVSLSSGDLSFAATKCYDLEVWAPGEERWLEVSSCSNFESFQARRASIRYRNREGKLEFVHTLNGSGVATPRLMVALLESCQTEEGTVMIPEALQPYTGFTVLK
ncbi:MAG: serine--tRNA ligase [Candidatus Marinimicrobia bacterium]|jgi:seryl-tRNA synthetase|nr:serine--tRNA ligase [Candidatus Neomarinimicrobiota bacterium]MDP6836219.1 serine--tRNA ligase [Candidatus Neomarinimicrobiota bacterium]|tara:strand:+ start:1736 stop:2998 length:1263 start_codon:yes stop_codon:yes gene_type:complete